MSVTFAGNSGDPSVSHFMSKNAARGEDYSVSKTTAAVNLLYGCVSKSYKDVQISQRVVVFLDESWKGPVILSCFSDKLVKHQVLAELGHSKCSLVILILGRVQKPTVSRLHISSHECQRICIISASI